MSSTSNADETTVCIIGAGVSGLTLATFLTQSGVACVILERAPSRSYVETRQRAGAVESRAVTMFERWGLADKLLGGPMSQFIEYRINGKGRVFEIVSEDGSQGRFCTQQMLVANLMKELIDGLSGDVRFGVSGIDIQQPDGSKPTVRYTHDSVDRQLACTYVVGCDGDQGVSRSSIPAGVLTKYSHEFGYAWLAALVDTPCTGPPIMGVRRPRLCVSDPSRPAAQPLLSAVLTQRPRAGLVGRALLERGAAAAERPGGEQL